MLFSGDPRFLPKRQGLEGQGKNPSKKRIVAPGAIVRGGTAGGRGNPSGTASKRNAGAHGYMSDTFGYVSICLVSFVDYRKTLSMCPERTVTAPAPPRTHFCGTPLCGTPLSIIPMHDPFGVRTMKEILIFSIFGPSAVWSNLSSRTKPLLRWIQEGFAVEPPRNDSGANLQ